jgi:antitoxin (DNA-binding transcriptional repressor) of toxin-antitoxin stability system
VIKVNVHEAETQFSTLLERAHAGEEIVLLKNGEPYARLAPLGARKSRQPGSLKSKVEASFFERLPDDEVEAWER